jgi:hypothetical protein
MEKPPPKKAPQAPPPEVKPKPPAPEVQPKPPEKAPAPEVAREKEAESPRKSKEIPGQGKKSAPPAAKPAVAAAKPLLVLRYRPRTFPVHVAETDTRSLEAVARKYGLLYSCTLAEPAPVSGLQWYAYQFQYRWYEKSFDSPEQLAAMEAELAGLWERFGFRVEVSRE